MVYLTIPLVMNIYIVFDFTEPNSPSAENCSKEKMPIQLSHYARPQVASYNTYYHSPPHLPPYSAYDFQVRFLRQKNSLLPCSCSLSYSLPNYGSLS